RHRGHHASRRRAAPGTTGLVAVARSHAVLRQPAMRRALAVVVALAFAAPAFARELFVPAPPSLVFETSIRSAAMGGASSAVMWGEPGAWANPASLYGVHGIGWVTGHTDVAPNLSGGVEFSSQRVLIGGGGLGFSFMGQP